MPAKAGQGGMGGSIVKIYRFLYEGFRWVVCRLRGFVS